MRNLEQLTGNLALLSSMGRRSATRETGVGVHPLDILKTVVLEKIIFASTTYLGILDQ